MATSKEELRQQLVAVIEAAPELPKEDRHHLADVFLDQLNGEYDLVPRGTGKGPGPANPPGRAWWRARWVPFALAIAFLFFVVPAAVHHFPLFLVAVVVVFFAVKRARSRRSSTAVFR